MQWDERGHQLQRTSVGKAPFQSAAGQDRAGVEQQSLQSLAEVPGSQTETLEFSNTQSLLTHWTCSGREKTMAHGIVLHLTSVEGCVWLEILSCS